jgi:photosystem II stability/assembly factor-like uncharacterized protein
MKCFRKLSLLVFVLGVTGFLSFRLQGSHSQSTQKGSHFSPDFYKVMKWRCIGPYRGGRVDAVTGVSDQPYLYYLGAVGGGVWKTEDGGLTWKNISDGYFKTGSVGAIAVADSDPNVIFVGTGEVDIRQDFINGNGVYKSEDAGKTWKNVGLEETHQIGKIRIHPHNPDLVYVAALGRVHGPSKERGIFRSKDGCRTWEKVLYVSDVTGAVDLAMDATNPRILYATFWQVRRKPWGIFTGGKESSLFKSTDGGDTWAKLQNGLPKGVVGRIGVTVSPVNNERLWSVIEAKDGGVFRSDNGGRSWHLVNDTPIVRDRGWYYGRIFADTQDAETVYVLTNRFSKSIDGGKTFFSIPTPHGDDHDLWIAPENNQRMIEGNDGGVNVSINGGKTWTTQSNQPTAQFYRVITDDQFPYRVYGAQQDNSTVSIASRSQGPGIDRTCWYPVGGGESGYIAPDPEDPNIVYAGSYYGLLTRYDHRTKQTRNISVWPESPGGHPASDVKYRFQWVFPILISPHDPNTLYAAGNVLFKSTNEGQSWKAISPDLTRNDKSKQGPSGGPVIGDNSSACYYCTIYSVAESPKRKGLIWTGSDDGLVHLTMDGGQNWQNVTPKSMQEWTRVSIIEASPHDEATAYIAANRYEFDDYKPYIYKTADYGKTWRLLVSGIPEGAFVRSVREDPKRKGLLYAGTETGVYVSFDDGENWQSLQINLPVVPIYDMTTRNDDLVVATHGRSFWILDDLTLLHQLKDEVASSKMHLFKPRDTYRMAGSFRFRGGSIGENPPSGVVVNYYFQGSPREEVTLEFLDAEGNLIKKFKSLKAKKEDIPENPIMAYLSGLRGGRNISANAGMNRFEWNMRYPDATPVPGDYIMWGGTTRGPLAVPRKYQVRLTLGSQSLTQPFEIKKDPRISTAQEDFEKQFALLMRIRDRVSDAHDAVNQILALLHNLKEIERKAKAIGKEALIEKEAANLSEKLKKIRDELIQVKIKFSNDVLTYKVKLNNKIAALTRVVARGDTAPTDQSYQVFDRLSADLDVQLKRLKDIIEKDIPAFNKLIKDEHIPAVPVVKK